MTPSGDPALSVSGQRDTADRLNRREQFQNTSGGCLEGALEANQIISGRQISRIEVRR